MFTLAALGISKAVYVVDGIDSSRGGPCSLNNHMDKTPFHILRIGLAITFLWIGVLIIKQPEAWAGYLQPWAVALLPVPITQAMIGTAIFDLVIGALLLIDVLTPVAAAAGALHLLIVLTTSGITDITARDIGLLAAAVAVMLTSMPASWKKRNMKPHAPPDI